jgi:hypothetical protein
MKIKNIIKEILIQIPYKYTIKLFGKISIFLTVTYFLSIYCNGKILKFLFIIGISYYLFNDIFDTLIWAIKNYKNMNKK